jgi:hypothetical protein
MQQPAATMAGTFSQPTSAPGATWHVTHGRTTACGQPASGEYWTTGIMPLFKVCPACVVADRRYRATLDAAVRFASATARVAKGPRGAQAAARLTELQAEWTARYGKAVGA